MTLASGLAIMNRDASTILTYQEVMAAEDTEKAAGQGGGERVKRKRKRTFQEEIKRARKINNAICVAAAIMCITQVLALICRFMGW